MHFSWYAALAKKKRDACRFACQLLLCLVLPGLTMRILLYWCYAEASATPSVRNRFQNRSDDGMLWSNYHIKESWDLYAYYIILGVEYYSQHAQDWTSWAPTIRWHIPSNLPIHFKPKVRLDNMSDLPSSRLLTWKKMRDYSYYAYFKVCTVV